MTQTSSPPQKSISKKADRQPQADQFCIVGTSEITLWGMQPAERLRRGFAQIGVTREISPAELAKTKKPVILARADAVIDTPLLTALAQQPGQILTGSDGSQGQRLAVQTPAKTAKQAADILLGTKPLPKSTSFTDTNPAEFDVAYWAKLRKREVPYAMAVTTHNIAQIEWRMFMATYKGATDFVTKHIWPWPAFHITRAIAPLGITPNMVTTLSAICVVLAYFFFQEGAWTTGLIAAWAMALLDTVDGKLARVTLTSSKWGDVFDHGIDLIHPPFWYLAWGYGLAASGLALSTTVFWWTMIAIFAGYILQRLMEGIAIKFLGLEIHIWRPIDTLFRQITARRNPNMAILTISVLFGRPDWGLLGVAAWTIICLVLHGGQIIQGLRARKKHGVLTSWLTKSATGS